MAQVEDIFGKITPPVGGPTSSNPAIGLGDLIGGGLNLVLIVIGMIGLVYMLWGAVSYVTSGGDKEKLQKAQGRIRNAVIGIFMAVVVLVIWNTVYLMVFKKSRIIRPINGGFEFNIPTFH